MIKESKYILRRILIGVGIVLVLGFLNGCKVKAFSNTALQYSSSYNTKTYYDNNNYFYLGSFPYGSYTNYVYLDSTNIYFASTIKSWVVPRSQEALPDNLDKVFITTRSVNQNVGYIYFWSDSFVKAYKGSYNSSQFKINSTLSNPDYVSFMVNANGITSEYSSCTSSTCTNVFRAYDSSSLNDYVSFASFPIYQNANSDTIIRESDSLPSSVPKFVSFNAIPITTNNIITSYTIQPEFTIFDTDNYIYQYSFDKNRWLSLNTNEQVLRINNNSTIYIRIRNLSNNDIIDSATFTITDISKFNNDQDYNITFSGEYRTMNYLNNTICVSSSNESVIKEYQIYIDYLPKVSILKYQYQYVNDGDSLDSNNWSNVSSLDNGSITYVASQNGTLYARILDSTDNVLYTGTFTINSIGKLAIDSKDNCVKNFFTKISSNINYGGPVSSLFVIPVNTLNALYSSMSNSSSCSPIQLGSLLGTNMQLGCYNFKSIVGNEVYNIIDIIFAFVLTIGVFKFILKLYNNFISMKEV